MLIRRATGGFVSSGLDLKCAASTATYCTAGGEFSSLQKNDRLPNHTALSGPTHHGRIRLAGKCAGERRKVGQRPNHAKLGYRMRVALHHEPLGFRPGLVSAELSPGDKELLIGRETVNDSRCRLALLCLLEREGGHLASGPIAD